jgi:predicted PurR-regulated permease PerM
MTQKIEISYKTIIFTVVLLLLIGFVFFIREIIYLFFVAFILMSAFKPWVDFLEKKHFPRVIGIIILYILLITALIFIGSSIVPVLVSETVHLSKNLPTYLYVNFPFLTIDSQTLSAQIAPLGENIIKLTIGIFGNLFAVFSIFVISLYLLLERKNVDSYIELFLGKKSAQTVIPTLQRVEERLGTWVRGQASLMLVIGIMTFIGLLILGIPYALPLALIAGILEMVPTVGPIISAIPAVLIGLTVNPLMGIAMIILYTVIQQIENHLVVPFVMRTVVGVPPVITILALMIGGKLAGVGGAILAVPVVVTIETLFAEFFSNKK